MAASPLLTSAKSYFFDALAGALSGAAASIPLSTLAVLASHRYFTAKRVPTTAATAPLKVPPEGNVIVPAPERRVNAMLAHIGTGALFGIPFGLLHRVMPPHYSRDSTGMLYGAALWTAAYLGIKLIPQCPVVPPYSKERPDWTIAVITSHIAYGAILGAGVRLLRPLYYIPMELGRVYVASPSTGISAI